MDNPTRQSKLKETFNAAAEGCDSHALRFFAHAADRLADRMALAGNEHILRGLRDRRRIEDLCRAPGQGEGDRGGSLGGYAGKGAVMEPLSTAFVERIPSCGMEIPPLS